MSPKNNNSYQRGRSLRRGCSSSNRSKSSNKKGYNNNDSNKSSYKAFVSPYLFAINTINNPIIATYTTVKDYLVQHIQNTFVGGHNIAQSLADKELVNLTPMKPKRQVSMLAVDASKAIEQDRFDIEYREDLRVFNNRKVLLEQQTTQAYSIILTSFCTRGMKQRIEEHINFKTKIKNDCIKLLKAIKVLMHNSVRG
jgi:hypothetical protein